ncbi:hypothetical protein ACHEUQ_03260 [Alloscardovia omnicolens]|uniref:hypothetical protein n=1 Tax=Alloscardovia omnicolens TaxID=419015 RepID=UPI000665C356|nr:hypothetical protein [Alloscardovia omnicolens]
MAKNTVQRIILYCGAVFEPFAQTDSFTLDYAYGNEENDFELTLENAKNTNTDVTAFRLENSTDIAGFVDTIESTYKNGYYTITYKGTSLQGILDKRIVQPATGQDYYIMNANLKTGLHKLLADTGLSTQIIVGTIPSITVNYQFERYCSVWRGLRKLARSQNCRIQLCMTDTAQIELSFVPVESTTINSANVAYTATRANKFITHMIALGEGELRNRAIGHAYWDGSQVVTSKPAGWKEGYTQTYEMNTIAADKINETAVEQLQKIIDGREKIQIKEPDGEYPLDSSFTITDMPTGMTISASVNKLIIKISKGVKTLSMEVG